MRDSVPVGGSGGEESPRAGAPDTKDPPAEEPSRDDRRFGVMYPEWDAFAGRYRTEWVAVLERRTPPTAGALARPEPEILRWFRQAPTRMWHDGLEDGTDLDVAAFIDRYCRRASGEPTDDRVYAALGPGRRDVATAVLLDASSSLQVGGGRAFDLELACADALVAAMGTTGERFAVFAFTGETRHRVEVAVLRDFDDPLGPIPRGPSLRPTGYTRLGAPLRHVTRRLLDTPGRAPGAAVDRRRPPVRRGLRGPLRRSRRGAGGGRSHGGGSRRAARRCRPGRALIRCPGASEPTARSGSPASATCPRCSGVSTQG